MLANEVGLKLDVKLPRFVPPPSRVVLPDGRTGAVRYCVQEVVPVILRDTLIAMTSSGAIAGAYQLLKTWVDARNGRKLKIKVGDIEVEATQMNEEDVLRIFELLEEKADRKKIREALIEAGKGGGRPEAR
jgi:hypothetical protein